MSVNEKTLKLTQFSKCALTRVVDLKRARRDDSDSSH